jgi:hypothetical protein
MITRLLFIGDTHCGSKVGLLPGGYRDEYGKKLLLGASQKLIWKQFKAIEKKAFKDCDELILVLMGDLVHGPDKDQPGQVDSASVKDQCDIFIHAILPIANKATSILSVDANSRFHVDPGRFADDYIASNLGAFGKRSQIKIDYMVSGLHFRFKHHGPMLGSRPHVRGDAVRRFLRDSQQEALETGEKAPDVFVFGHWHTPYWEPLKVRDPKGDKLLQAFYCPPLTFPDKRTINVVPRLDEINIGALALDVDGEGNLKSQEWWKTFSTRTVIKH